MATDEHQIRVDVSGHAAMSWNGVVVSWRDQGGTFGMTLLTTLHQGTKSKVKKYKQINREQRCIKSVKLQTQDLPAILC